MDQVDPCHHFCRQVEVRNRQSRFRFCLLGCISNRFLSSQTCNCILFSKLLELQALHQFEVGCQGLLSIQSSIGTEDLLCQQSPPYRQMSDQFEGPPWDVGFQMGG